MKATIDIPDELYRQLKAASALEGRAVRDVAIGLFQRWVDERNFQRPAQEPSTAPPSDAVSAWIARWDALGAEVARRSVDPRPAVDILHADRR
jgi:hypothetical protein